MIKNKHLGVYCLVYSPEGQLAFIEKTRGPYTGTYDLPGGSLEYGEKIEEALTRELEEEIGLTVTEFELKRPIAFNYPHELDGAPANLYHVAIIYEVRLSEAADIAPVKMDEDVAACIWIDEGKLGDANLSPLAKEALGIE